MNRWQIRRVCTVWFCVVCCLTASSVCSAVTFVNVAVEAGVDFRYTHGGTGQKFFIETMGPGCAFLDYDGDGGLDIYAVNGHSLKEGAQAQETNHLFRNKGNGTFADVSVAAGVDDRGYGVGVTATTEMRTFLSATMVRMSCMPTRRTEVFETILHLLASATQAGARAVPFSMSTTMGFSISSLPTISTTPSMSRARI